MSKKAFYLAMLLLLAAACLRLQFLPAPQAPLEKFWQRQAEAIGTIDPFTVKHTAFGTSFILRCESLKIAGQKFSYAHNLRLSLSKKVYPSSQPLEAGRIRCKGTLFPLTSFRNPGGLDGERYALVQDLGGRMRAEEAIVMSEESTLLDKFALLNLQLRREAEAALPGEAGALISGMVLGGSGGIGEETREIMQNNGLAHLLSVSGTHLLLLAALLRLLFCKLPKGWSRILTAGILVLYACLTGLRPPILRALAMSWAVLFAAGESSKAGRGKLERGRVLLLTAALMLTWRPVWLCDLGFQLSFAAAAGLLLLLPPLEQRLSGRFWGLGEAMAVTLAAQLGVLPLEAGCFHRLVPIALLSNLLLVPLLEGAVVLCSFGLVLHFLPLPAFAAAAPLSAGAFLLEQVLRQGQLLTRLPFAAVSVPELPLFCVPLYYAVLCLALDLGPSLCLSGRARKAGLALSLALLTVSISWQYLKPRPLTVYFLDVGQGDCTVIVSPQGKTAMIDTGGLANFDTGSRIAVPFLRSLGRSSIDHLFLTHGDLDHVGGSGGLSRNLNIKNIILPAQGKFSSPQVALAAAKRDPSYKELLRRAKDSKAELAQKGRRYDLGGAALVILDVPEAGEKGNEASTLCALFDEAGRPCLLLPGDLGKEREEKLKNLGTYPVLKAGHHGSRGSSGEKFLRQVRPLLTVISCGPYNRHGHPHKETLARLRKIGSKVLRTDEGGCITVTFDEGGVKCYSYK